MRSRGRRAPGRHDRDAGGPRELLEGKQALREEIWSKLRAARVARFPGVENRIPNFVGAEAAAARLRRTSLWAQARTLKCNPDSPQRPVRAAALQDGKLVAMAVPRLASEQPFFLLDPRELSMSARAASSIRGASGAGRTVDFDALDPVDLVVTGCVAVGEDGARLGKGGGFSDLELAIATEAGLVGPKTRVVTTVHEIQVLPAGAIPVTAHDVRVDMIVTPDRVIRCPRRGRARASIRWDELTEEKIASIPVLRRLARLRSRSES